MIPRQTGRPEFWAAADAASPLCLTALKVAAGLVAAAVESDWPPRFSPELKARPLTDDSFEITLADGGVARLRVEPASGGRPPRVVWLELHSAGD